MSAVPRVTMTQHLFRYFPVLRGEELEVPAGSVAEILRAIDRLAPGFAHYVLDDTGALRRHVNLSIDDTVVIDRKTLSDHVPDGATLYIFQALSGG